VKKEFSEEKAELLLPKLNVLGIMGVIKQLADVTKYAEQVFQGLQNIAFDNYDRLKVIRTRVTNLTSEVSNRSPKQIGASPFVISEEVFNHTRTQHFLFGRKSIPASVQILYDAARSKPDFEQFGEEKDGVTWASRYSHPKFFMEQWVQAELKKQEENEEKRKKKKAARKEKREKRRKEEKDDKGQNVRVKAKVVARKKYDARGAEFAMAEGDLKNDSQQPEQRRASLVDEKNIEEPMSPPPQSLQVQMVFPNIPFNASPHMPHEMPQAKAGGGAFPPPPSMPPQAKAGAPGVVSPPAPRAPTAPTAPIAPVAPLNVARPNDLLSGIQAGVTLKKVVASGADLSASGGPKEINLMDQIRSGKQLRKVQVQEEQKEMKSPTADEGTYGQIMKLLDRRKFIEEENDDEDDDHDSDWED